jgi:hypothetical protein
MDALGTKLTDMMKTEGQTKTVNALNRLNSEMVNLTTVEEGAARELSEQTEKIERVAEAQKQLVEIQRQIGEAGGVKFEGLGEGLKKIATADLLGRVAKQSGSRVGAARFDAQKFDAIQKLQGGQGTLSKGQREKAREAARIQGEAAYTAMRNTGQFKDEMFEGDRPGVAIGRKGAARFKSDDFKDASKDVQDTLERSEGDLKSVLDQMQAITDKSAEQEEAVLGQIESLASATQQLQVATDKMVENQKIVFEQGQVKMKGGMWGAASPLVQMKYVSDLIDRSVTKGAAAAKTELVVKLDIPGLDPGVMAKVNENIARAKRKSDEAKNVIVDNRSPLGDVTGGI